MRKLVQWLEKQSEFRLAGIGLLLVWLVAVADMVSYARISYTLFYLAFIAGAAWVGGKRIGVLLALASTFLMLNEEWIRTQTSRQHWILWWNTGVRLGMFLFTAWVVARLQTLTQGLESLVRERTAALETEVAERRRTEAQLRNSNERFRQVTESITEVFWMSSFDKNQLIYISPGYETIWGRTCESLYALPRNWVEAIHPEDRDRVLQAALTKQVRGEYEEEYRILRPDGSLRWIRDRAFPIRDETGAVRRISGIAEDITERKRAEDALSRAYDEVETLVQTRTTELAAANAALLKANSILRAINEGTTNLICLKDRQGKILAANPAMCHFLGRSESELIGQDDLDSLPDAEQAAQVRAHDRRIMETGRTETVEEAITQRDRQWHCLFTKSPYRDANGNIIGVIGIGADITERKRMDEALRQSEARLRMALDASRAGVWSWDVASNSSTWDDQYHAQYGFEPHEPKSFEAWIGRVHPQDRERLQARIRELLKPAAGTSWNEDFRALHPVKGERWMTGLGRVERDPAGNAVRFNGINLDVTERKQAEEAIRHLNATLDQRVRDRTAELEAANTALRESEELLRAFFDSPGALRGVVELVEDDLLVLSANAVQAAAYHRTPAQMHRVRASELGMPRSVIDLWRKNFQESQQRNAPVTFEYSNDFRTPGGWGMTTVSPLVMKRGEPPRFAYVAIDITERRRAEQALRNSESRYRQLVDAAQDVIFTITPDSTLTSLNPAFETLTGWPRAEWIGKSFLGLVEEASAPAVRTMFERTLRGEPTAIFDLGVRAKSGSLVAQISVSPQVEQGRVAGVLGIARDITERKQAEQALRESEERFRRLFEGAKDAIFWADADTGLITHCNPAAESLLGRERAEIVGQPQTRLHPPEETDRYRKIFRKRVAMEPEVFPEVEVIRKDGPRVIAEVSASVTEVGGRKYVQGIFRDVTERKRAEKQQRRLTAILEASPDFVGYADARDTHILYINQAGRKMLGLSEDADVTRLTITDVHPEWTNKLLREEILPVASRERFWTGECAFRHCDGHEIPVAMVLQSHRGPDGKMEMFSTVSHDITGRKQAEQTLRESEQRFRQLAEAAFEGIAFIENGRLIDGNTQLGTMLGYELSEMIGRPVSDFIAPQSRELVARQVSTGYEAPYENLNLRKDGSVFPVEAHARQMTWHGKTVRVAALRNLSEQKRLERQILEISDREQARIGQDIHDGLCQQLISAAFDLGLLHDELTRKSKPEAARARRLAAVLDDAISEARYVSRGLYPVKLDVGGLVSALQELTESVTRRFHVACVAECAEAVRVRDNVTATHLYRIAQEAVVNVVKHAQARHIHLRLSTAQNGIELTVTDDGVGLPAARGDTAGMGLHIMDYRARTIGGTLEVHPRSGGGTTVSCCVPLPTV